MQKLDKLLWQEGPLVLAALLVFAATFYALSAGYTLPAHWGEPAINWQNLNAKPHWVTGTIAAIRPHEGNPNRVTLRLENVTGYQAANMPAKLGIGVESARVASKNLAVGQGVAAEVILFPPDAPAYPGDRDFRPFSRYRADSAHGYVSGRMEPTTLPPLPPTPISKIETFRQSLIKATQGLAGGVATALLVGETKGIQPDLTSAYRAAGLSHLLAISGMQLSVAGLGIFWLVRRLLATWPRLALTHNIRLYAALIGLAAVPVYALVAGAGVSVVRAAIMVGFFLFAVAMGRVSSRLRAWALALAGMSLIWPESALSAGFQLSFAATLALILGQAAGLLHGRGLFGHLRQIAITSWLAGLATLPFVAGIFGQVSLVSLPANLLAVPLMGIVGTWLSLVVLALWPIGFGAYLLPPLVWLCELTNTIATTAAEWPQSLVSLAPEFAWPLAGLCLVALAFCYVRAWLLAGVFTLAGLGLAYAAAATTPQPKLVLIDGGDIGLYRTAEHTYAYAWKAAYNAPAERWARRWGHKIAENPPLTGTCDPTGCTYATPYGPLAVLQNMPTPEDCTLAKLIVAPAPGACPAKTLSPENRWQML